MEKVVENKVFNRRPPMLVALVYESDNNVVSQRLVEKLKLPTSFHLNQARIKFSTRQCVKEVLCDIAPTNSCNLLLRWAWVHFKTLNLDEWSLYLRQQRTRCLIEGHPCLVAFVYESDNNAVSQRLVEKLKLPTSFHPNEARIKFSTGQGVK